MANKKRSRSSKRWIYEHFKDKYFFDKFKKQVCSRSWFKLDEIQTCSKIFTPGMVVIDLGSAPGGWTQYAVSKVGKSGKVIACDLLPMTKISGACIFQGDFRDKTIVELLCNALNGRKAQVIMSDMCPNISGIALVDTYNSWCLVKAALDFCHKVLIYGGSFIVKIFQGTGFNEYLQKISLNFLEVKIRKPNASRSRSRELFLVAKGYKKA